VAFALVAAVGGLLLGLSHPAVKASVFITTISFVIYALARVITAGAQSRHTRRSAGPPRSCELTSYSG
jgi:zinc/manganese transport system permease protein